MRWKVLTATFFNVAPLPWPAIFMLSFLEIKDTPLPVSNKKLPNDDDWKNSYSAPTGPGRSESVPLDKTVPINEDEYVETNL